MQILLTLHNKNNTEVNIVSIYDNLELKLSLSYI